MRFVLPNIHELFQGKRADVSDTVPFTKHAFWEGYDTDE